MTVYVPRPWEEPPPKPVIYIGDQRIEHVNNFQYLGQVISSDVKTKGEISRRIGQAYAAFRSLERRGIWKDKTISRRTKLTIYKVTVLTIMLYCSETWSIWPKDVKKLETAQMMCLRRICGDRSWGRTSTHLQSSIKGAKHRQYRTSLSIIGPDGWGKWVGCKKKDYLSGCFLGDLRDNSLGAVHQRLI